MSPSGAWRRQTPAGKNVYHVMLAAFDHATGARITDADVVATVAPLGLAGARKRLDATTVAGAVTYCNDFRMSAGENYVIRARIRRPGTAEVAAEFTLLAHAPALPTGKWPAGWTRETSTRETPRLRKFSETSVKVLPASVPLCFKSPASGAFPPP